METEMRPVVSREGGWGWGLTAEGHARTFLSARLRRCGGYTAAFAFQNS